MRKTDYSANGKRAMSLGITWKALLAVAAFGLACGIVGCRKKSGTSDSSSAKESPSSATADDSSSSVPQDETKTFTLPGGVKLEMVQVHIERESQGFWIGKYEVTQGQWDAVMGNNPSGFKGADLPVENVSWNDCQDFIRKLNALPEVKKSGWKYRLPTELEWEYACRAGSTGNYCKLADGTDITDDSLGEVAWYNGNSTLKTHPVGKKAPNAFGLYDMSGNVWEWCEDRYRSSDSQRVFRGGSWGRGSEDCRASFRGNGIPDDRGDSLGFRLAATCEGRGIAGNGKATVPPRIISRELATWLSRLPKTMVAIPDRNYAICKYEVTQGLWEAVMGNNPSLFKGADLPVENVSWLDCQDFIRRLNALPEVKESGFIYRLPTEEEWKYACHAGTKGRFCRLADGTDITEETLDNVAWYDRNSESKTHATGQKKPNAFGLYDMNGNVSEWCQDLSPASDSDRVIHGGSFVINASCCQASLRIDYAPDYRGCGVGFRLAAFQGASGVVGSGKQSGDSGNSSASESLSLASNGETKTFNLPGGVELEMVYIEQGGRGFWLGKYEMTQGLWEKVMGNNPSDFKGENLPVEKVSWDDCQKFIKKLNALPGVKESGLTYRLPTEKEWEYACRAGSTGDYCKLADGTEITEGTLAEVAWYGDNSKRKTLPVGKKKPNAFGLYDMHGNVQEWCEDLVHRDRNSIAAFRGGSWSSESRSCRASNKISYYSDSRHNDLGFRLAAIYDKNRAAEVAKRTSLLMGLPDTMVAIPGRRYAICKYEVTQDLWVSVMGSNPSSFKGDDLPVENVSWNDCQAFLKKLNALPEVKESGWTYRLPTSGEWVYACRAGSTGNYCKLGDGTEITKETLGDVAWYDENCEGETHPVGKKEPNAFGLYDMHGNVAEWCETTCDVPPVFRPTRNDAFATEAGYSGRACHGGSGASGSWDCRASDQCCLRPGERHNVLGFRLAATLNVKR